MRCKDMEKTNKYYKSVSKLLDRKFVTKSHTQKRRRGKIYHETFSRFNKKIFKTPDRSRKINYRVYSQRITKAYNDILLDFQRESGYELYYEDIKILLNSHRKKVIYTAKGQAKQNNYIIIPEEVERALFNGVVEFESEAVGKIGGFNIPARADIYIERDANNFVLRDFKSYILENGDDPSNPNSKLYKDFMQVCLYGIIFEQDRSKRCNAVELMYFPDKVLNYQFTDELRELTLKFAMDTAFEGFENISFQFHQDDNDDSIKQGEIIDQYQNSIDLSCDESLGWINTIKGKPLQIIMGQDNKMEGFLYPNEAHQVKVGYCVIVEKEDDGVRIMCIVKRIECSEDCFPGETSSHKEENYKITLIPAGQFNPKGYQDLLPQTVIGGKIKIPTNEEFCEFKKISQNGIPIGNIQGLNTGIPYPLEIKTLYQSIFMSGQQGTGKTTSLKSIALQIAQVENAPAQIILDNEGEYGNLRDIPTNNNAKEVMRRHGIKELELGHFRLMNIDMNRGYCLTLKAIDPVDLPYFLHELTAISHDTLQTIIYDIIEDHKEQEFILPELVKLIIKYIENKKYGATEGTKKAIMRAMTSISLRTFDVPGVQPIDFESILVSGKITVINTYNLRDYHQRIVGIYLLAMLHKRALKGKDKINVVFFLDEIQRLIPKSKSNSDSEYQKRIIKFLDEVVHRGRKRDYGVIFATQSVADVKKEIIDLCNTKVFFQTQGSGINYIKEYFSNKEDLERLRKLPVGHAFIISKGKHEPVEIKFPNIN